MALSGRDDHADWFQRNLDAAKGKDSFVLLDAHRRCLNTLGVITEPSGLYNLPCPGAVTDAVQLWDWGLSALITGEFSTFDASQLTRLVLAAHRDRVRVSISPWCNHLDEERARCVVDWRTAEYESDRHDRDWEEPWVGAGVMEVTLHVKKAVSDYHYDSHPGLADLAEQCVEWLT